jgi:dihydroxyacetone kinase-like protein
LVDAVREATTAARRGMRSTRPLVARRGLAMRLGERSRGHLDPGAVSCFLLVRALVAPEPEPA